MIQKMKRRKEHKSFRTKILLMAFAACPLLGPAYAATYNKDRVKFVQQTIRVAGKVVDANTNQALSNVSIYVNGKSVTSTKADGSFVVDAAAGAELRFSLIGYTTHVQKFNQSASNITISLQDSSQDIEEVVVTALGIKREQKALGYSVTTVNNEELTDAMANNWTEALSGKVAGLNLVKSGGGPAGTNQIILRGETSLSGENGALIVVDGVVMGGGTQMTGNGNSNYQDADSPVDFGTSLADINPDDIESISILKGPGASALYGYRGARGAIIITTKSGQKNQKGLGITVNSNTSVGTINRWPDYQYEYGQGVRGAGGDLYYSYGQSADGPSTYSTSSAWGPKFNGQMYYQYTPGYYRTTPPERTLWQAYPNNRKELFDPSFTTTNSISVSGGNNSTTARVSYTNVYNSWIVPNTGYQRNSVAVNVVHKLSDKLSISPKLTYNNRNSDNLPNTGYNNQTYMYFIRGMVPNFNTEWFKPGWLPDREGIEQITPFSNLLDNPYVIAYEMLNAQNKHHFIGNVQVDYKFNDFFSIMARTGIDFSFDKRKQRRPFDTYRYAQGFYKEQNVFNQEMNSDFLLKYNNDKGEVFKFSVSAGGAFMNRKYDKTDYATNKLVNPNVYNFSNSAENLTYNPYRSEIAVHSVFGMANFSYKNWLFWDFTGRVDWASTLASPITNKVPHFFYPSFNMSAVLSDLFELPKNISFWKLRFSAAGVGGGGDKSYLNSYTYDVADNFSPGLRNPQVIPNLDLKHENKVSYELGTDFRMFKNRLNVDLTVYKANNYDQILQVPIDPSSGYRWQVINGGNVANKGIEFSASYDVFKKKDGFRWKPYGNFNLFDTEIVSLADSVNNIVLSTIFGSRGTVEARVGGKFGDLYGFGYVRNENGDIVYDEFGFPLASSELIYLGNANANFKWGFGNEFRYKNFKLNILIDGQKGGVGYSLTHAVLMEEGKLKKTLPGRMNGIIGKGVVSDGNGGWVPNTKVVDAGDYYYAHFNRDQLEANTFSTDFIKLREVRFDYTFPKDITSKLKVQKAVIGVYGRDLLVFSNWPAFDPEFASLTGDNIQKGAEIAQFPSTRNFGINLSFSF